MRYLFVLILCAVTCAADVTGKAPDFTLMDMDGKKVALRELTAQGPVLIDFWATWCKPCLHELQHLDNICKQYQDKGLQVVGISVDNPRSQAKVKPFIKSNNYSFTVLLDPNQTVLKLFGGTDVPLTLLIDGDGKIIYNHLGYVPGDELLLQNAVEQLFAPPADSVTAPAN